MSASPLRNRPRTALLHCGRAHCVRSGCRGRRACHSTLSAGGVAPRPDNWTARSACVCPGENVRCAPRGLPAYAPEPELDRPSLALAQPFITSETMEITSISFRPSEEKVRKENVSGKHFDIPLQVHKGKVFFPLGALCPSSRGLAGRGARWATSTTTLGSAR